MNLNFNKSFILKIFLISICVSVFYDYVNNINVFKDLNVNAYSEGKEILNDIKVTGITYLNFKHVLTYSRSQNLINKGYFKRIEIEFINPKTKVKSSEVIIKYSTIIERVYLKSSSRKIIWIPKHQSFFSKFRYLIDYTYSSFQDYINSLNWLVKSSILIFGLYFLFFVSSIFNFQFKFRLIFFLSRLKYESLLLASIFIVAFFLRFNSGLRTIISFDFEGHLGFVCNYLNSENFFHYEFSYIYPTFVIVLLKLFNNFNSIVIVQHLLALFSVFSLYLIIRKYYLNKIQGKSKVFFTLLLIFVIQLILFNQNLIFYEKTFHHEGTLISYFSFLLCFLILYSNSTSIKKQTLILVFLLVLMWIGSLLHYRFSIGFYLCFILLFIYHLFLLKKINSFSFKPFLFVIILVIIIQTPEQILMKKYDQINKAFPYKQFFYSNAFAINQALKEGYTINPEFDKTILEGSIHFVISKNDEKRFKFPILGYNFDELKYGLVNSKLEIYILKNLVKTDTITLYKVKKNYYSSKAFANKIVKYYQNWDFLLLKEYKFLIFKKILNQYISFFSYGQVNYCNPYYNNYYSNLEANKFFISTKKLIRNKKVNLNPIKYDQPKPPLWWSFYINKLVPMLLLFTLIINLYLLIKRKIGIVTVCLFLIVVSTITTIAILHTFDISRYAETLFPFILFLIFFTLNDFFYFRNSRLISKENIIEI